MKISFVIGVVWFATISMDAQVATDILEIEYPAEMQHECARNLTDDFPDGGYIVFAELEEFSHYTLSVGSSVAGQQVTFEWDQSEVVSASMEESTLRFVPISDRLTIQVFVSSGTSSFIGTTICNVSERKKHYYESRENSVLLRDPPIITTGGTPDDLVRDVFIQSSCFDIEGVTFSGSDDEGIAEFSGTEDVFGFDAGIVLSCGSVNDLGGVNLSTNDFLNDIIGGGGDPDLQQLAGSNIQDAQILTFTFTPTVEEISFEYAFASEEYCDYVNSPFNDAFGFFISGPGINGPFSNGAENIALIPGSNDFVSINSVNYNSNSENYVSNVPPGQPQDDGGCPTGEVGAPAANPNDILFDGFTTRLTATATVIPCEEYTIKLAIGDGGTDAQFGSAVFLAANSFFIGDNNDFEVVYNSQSGSSIKEDCNDDEVCIEFTRTGEDISDPASIPVSVADGSVAIELLDFPELPDSLFFAAGEATTVLCIQAIPDDLEEGIESLLLEFGNVCPCEDPIVEVLIEDNPQLAVEFFGDSNLCEGDQVNLEAIVVSGNEPYEYIWSTGEMTAVIMDDPDVSTTYTVTVTDDCSNEDEFEFAVDVVATPEAELSGGGILCSESTDCITLTATMTGQGPWDLSYMLGSEIIEINDILTNPYEFDVCDPNEVTLLSIADRGCPGDASGSVLIEEIVLVVEEMVTDIPCFGESTGSIDITVTGGIEPYTFQWSNMTDQEDLTDVPAGIYSVDIEDANGCMTTRVFNLAEGVPIIIELLEVNNVDCSGPLSGSILVTAFGGFGDLSYEWSNGADNVPNPDGLGVGVYSLTVTDELGCTAELLNIPVLQEQVFPEAEAGPDRFLSCASPVISLTGEAMFALGDATVLWTTTDGNIVSDPDQFTVDVDAPGVYYFEVNNGETCLDIDSMIVGLDTIPPVIEVQGDDSIDCIQTLATISVISNVNSSYQWSTTDGNIVGMSNGDFITVDQAGTYIVEVTGADNGCTSSGSFVVDEFVDPPEFDIFPPDIIDCINSEIWLSADQMFADIEQYVFLWSTSDGDILSPANVDSVLVGSAGTYILSVTNSNNGCSDTRDVLVTEDIEEYDISIADPPSLTCDATSIVLDASASEMDSDLLPQWSNSNGEILQDDGYTVEIDAPGDYVFSLTNTINGCSSSQVINVPLEGDLPTAMAEVFDTITCTTVSVNLMGSSTTSGSLSYSWSTVEGTIETDPDMASVSVSEPGSYIFTVVNEDNGCFSSDTVEVIEDTRIPQIAFDTDIPLITCDSATQALVISTDLALEEFQFVWSTLDGTIESVDENTAVVSSPGEYFVQVVNWDNGCSDEDSITVDLDQNSPLSELAETNFITCSEPVVTVFGESPEDDGSFEYSWNTSNGNILGDPTLSSIDADQPGEYVVEIRNPQNGCITLDTIELIPDIDVPSAQLSFDGPITCDETVREVTSEYDNIGALQFLWSTDDGLIDSDLNLDSISVSSPGTYTLTITNTLNGCESMTSVVVDIDTSAPTAVASAPDPIDCLNPEVTVSGNGSSAGPQYSYAWSSETDGILTDPSQLDIQVGEPGMYQLEVRDNDNGCTTVAIVEVLPDDNSPLASIVEPAPLNCLNTSIVLDGSGSTIDNTNSATWIFGGSPIANDVPTITVDQPGIYIIEIVNEDNGCISIDSVEVLLDDEVPEIEYDIPAILTCEVQQLTLDATASVLTQNTQVLWTLPDQSVVVTSVPQLEINQAGPYVLTLIDTVNGCSDEQIIEVLQDTSSPEAIIVEPSSLSCEIGQVELTIEDVVADWQYTWSSIDGIIDTDPSEASILVSQAGIYSVTVVNPTNGCESINSILVEDISELPDLSLNPPASLTCEENTVIVTVAQGSQGPDFEYSWSTIDGLILDSGDPLSIEVGEGGTYTLVILNTNNGCSVSESVEVEDLRDIVTADLRVDQPSCDEETGSISWDVLMGVPPVVASLDGGLNFFNVNSFDDVAPGEYSLLLEDNIGCRGEFDFEILDQGVPQILLPIQDTIIRLGESFQIQVLVLSGEEFIDSIAWTGPDVSSLSCTNCLNPVATPTASTFYTVSIWSAGGCLEQRTVNVAVDQTISIYIPNVFSPNGDEINDFFTVFGDLSNVREIHELSVYDRWGELVFRSQHTPINTPSLGWDGRLNGEDMNPAVFIYVADIELVNGLIVNLTGDITLVR